MEINTNIDVLLSTYNGDLFLKDQLDSILTQDRKASRILIRDDGSTDETRNILQGYSEIYPEIEIFELGENIGVVNSFTKLLESASAPYIVFCDQDDVWKPWKLERIVEILKQEEKAGDSLVPCLVISEMDCIDANGNSLDEKFSEIHGISLRDNSFLNLLLQNVVTGAACGFNGSLQKIAIKGCSDAYLHDWWLALVAAAFGKIVVIDDVLTSYRVHENNAVGASSINLKRLTTLNSLKKIQLKLSSVYERSFLQAKLFMDAHGNDLNESHFIQLSEYLALHKMSFLRRRIWMFHNKLKFSSKWRTSVFYLLWR